MMIRIVFVLLLCLLLPSPAVAEKRVALVIGIDKYDNLGPSAQLRKARSDAAAVARVLRDLGFDVIAKEDVTRSAFNSHWQDFLNKLTPGDTAAFYFAGHGVEFGGRTYLLPRDVPIIKPGRDELLRREALSLHEFLADLKEKGTRLNLVILDACRDNPFEQVAGRSVGSRRGLAITEPPEGTFIMYSAGVGESALDVLNAADRDPNSVYTRHLLPLLKTPGLPLTEVAEQVRVSVRQMAETVQHRQTPAYYNQVLGRVCLAGGDCGSRLSSAPAQPTEAERVWPIVKDTASIPALEAFISRFGDTYYGDLAKLRLGELKQADVGKQANEAAKKKTADERKKLIEVAKNKVEEDARLKTATERQQAERSFDGQWLVNLTCPRAPDGTEAYSRAFIGRVNGGTFRAEYGVKGKPKWLSLQGEVDSGGKARITATGLTSYSRRGVGRPKPGTLYSYEVIGQFEGTRGYSKRHGGRECDLVFTKQ
jgi:hypothetical protein